MLNELAAIPKRDGLDTTIKVLTILKLLCQLGFYGILLGVTIWFLVKNPLPKMMEDMQQQMTKTMLQQFQR